MQLRKDTNAEGLSESRNHRAKGFSLMSLAMAWQGITLTSRRQLYAHFL